MTKVLEEEQNKSAEEEMAQDQGPRKFVLMVPSVDGQVLIRLEGIDMDEARKLISMGHIKFEIEYDAYLRRTVK